MSLTQTHRHFIPTSMQVGKEDKIKPFLTWSRYTTPFCMVPMATPVLLIGVWWDVFTDTKAGSRAVGMYVYKLSQLPKTARDGSWGVLTSKMCLRNIWGSAILHSPKVFNVKDYSSHSLVQKNELQFPGIKHGSVWFINPEIAQGHSGATWVTWKGETTQVTTEQLNPAQVSYTKVKTW